MSHALIDKRCTENCAKAQLTVDISRTVEAPIEEIFIFEYITNTGPHVILHAARCFISGYILFEAWGENQTTPWLIIALAIFSKPAMLAPATRLPFMP